jgi:hypothetical protein
MSRDAAATSASQPSVTAGAADPAALADFLYRLQDLAQAAFSDGSAIYCWICV